MRHSIEEIGLELGTDLQALHDSILRDEFPQLDVPGIAVQQRDRQQTVPTQLPESDAYFIGRSREQWLMDDVLLDGSAQNHSPIAYITGSPGIGKTSLAVNWAHRTAHRFPDGQLFADLREGDTLGVLHRFLRQLGAEGPLPTEPADAAERYRGMLEGRRVLIVLDHASSYTQVRHLLPTSGGCCVLITGRANLDELMQKYRALRLRVAPLSDDESRETLTSVLRDARAEESPEATSRLAGLCGHTPLALRAAAARLLTKTHWRVLDLVRRLERSGDRLAELSIGDDSLRARLDRSMRELDPRVASAYRDLSRLDDTDFDAAQAAQVLGTDLLEAEDLIETLVDAQLLEAVGRGGAWGEMRYRWQELVRLHALHCLTAATPCGAALTD
ncbi:ATP-binding protein [Streptomyces sp. UP1A-1]|nr:ATP-binding protein [Streptomyces sp. UP1A-1]